MTVPTPHDDLAIRAQAWHHGAHAAVCDVIEPWQHGTVVRATRYPSYFDFNVVRVEADATLSVEELETFADEALAGLGHRRVDFDFSRTAEPLRSRFEAKGWTALRLSWMRHELPPPPGPDIAVEDVPYNAVHELRVAWHQEESPGLDPGGYHRDARAVALSRDVRVLASMDGEVPVAFAQLECDGGDAEITQVYVRPDYRGGGRGTAMTRAAIAAAAGARDLWICADDQGRPKELYARLGFRPAGTTMEFQRLPRVAE